MRDAIDVVAFDFPSLPPEIRNHIAKCALSGRNVYLPQIRKIALLDREPRPKPNIMKRFNRFVRLTWHYSLDYRFRRHQFEPKLPYTPPQ